MDTFALHVCCPSMQVDSFSHHLHLIFDGVDSQMSRLCPLYEEHNSEINFHEKQNKEKRNTTIRTMTTG